MGILHAAGVAIQVVAVLGGIGVAIGITFAVIVDGMAKRSRDYD